MPKVDIWMPVYIGDYLRDTVELTDKEHGAYFLLMLHYWQKKGDISNEIDRLARVARTDEKTCRFILGSFFKTRDGKYVHKRIDEELEKAENRREKASLNGKKGGRPPKEEPDDNPKETHRFNSGKPDANPQESSSSSSSSLQSTSNTHKDPAKPLPPAVRDLKPLSNMKDELATYYQTLLTDIYPYTGWGDISQERTQLNTLAKKTKALFNTGVPYADAYQTSEAIVKRFLTMKQSGFWKAKDKPVTPSSLSACWAEVIDGLIKEHAKSQPFEEVDIF